MIRMWLSVDWDAPEPALRALEKYCRSVRECDPAELLVAGGTLEKEQAGARLLELLNQDPELSARLGSLPDVTVVDGDVPDDIDEHLRLPGPGEPALRVLREELAPYVAVTPVLNQEEWARTWQPEAGFRHLVIDNASDDDTAQILSDRGADVVVNETRLSRVDNWRRAVQVFQELDAGEWMKWVFAGDRLLPGAATVLDNAIAEYPDVRVITAQYQMRHPDGGVTRFAGLRDTQLVPTAEALHRFVLQGNWMGGPIAIALHRDVLDEMDFGHHPWIADWQASMSLALNHPVLHVAEPIGLFDGARGRYHTAHDKDVSTVVQDSAMRYQALEHLRERGANLPLAELEAKVDQWLANEATRRIKSRRDAVNAPPGMRTRMEAESGAGGAARMRVGNGRGAVAIGPRKG
jgi:hypothetical protein